MGHFFFRQHSILAIALIALSARVGLTASPTDDVDPVSNATARVTVRGTELREFDWAKSEARARIAYVSSGARTFTGRMIDNDLGTAFRFSARDTSPTVIVELAQSPRLHRITAAFKAEDARVDVYLLNALPKNPDDLRFLTPLATIVDAPDNRGTASVDFTASGARYVALRWNRNKSQEPFEVAEISAFSNDPTDLMFGQDPHLAANTGPSFATTEPPTVPVVSP
jgi:hypothetical protein